VTTGAAARTRWLGGAGLAALLALTAPPSQAVTPADPCRLTLAEPPRMLDGRVSPALLARLFTAAERRDGPAEVGEGQTRPGTFVYPDDPARRLAVVWGEPTGDRTTWLMVDGRSRWTAHRGVRVGTDLRTLERLNGRPFVLAGFAWDYGGTVVDWRGGGLSTTAALPPCRLIVRLSPGPGAPADLTSQVAGDRDFPSDHPAMAALNPTVYQILLALPPASR